MKVTVLGKLCALLLLVFVLTQCTTPTAAPAPTSAPAAQATAASKPTAAPQAAEKILKVGVDAPLTGPSARTGQEFKCSIEMAFEKIGYKIGDYKVQLVWIDDQSDPEKGSRGYEQAIVQDGIQTGLANWNSSVAVALMDLAAKYKIPHFFAFGATEVINNKYKSDPQKYGYWIGKFWPVPATLTGGYVTAVEEAITKGTWKPRNKIAAVFAEDTDWGRSFGKGMKDKLKAAGWTVADEQYFPYDQTDFYPLLNKFKSADVSLLAGTISAPPSVSAFIKQADEVGVKATIIADGLGWVGEWYKLTGKSSDYVIDQIPAWTTDAAKKFVTDFKAKCNIDPSPSGAGLSYDAANYFIQVAKNTLAKSGSLNKDTLYQYAKDNVVTGKDTYKDGIVMQEYKYTPETSPDPVVGKGFYTFPVLQYFGGDGKVVWPAEWKVTDLKPKP
jgi:branched-chain amino acid transport system substrate-binding protein